METGNLAFDRCDISLDTGSVFGEIVKFVGHFLRLLGPHYATLYTVVILLYNKHVVFKLRPPCQADGKSRAPEE